MKAEFIKLESNERLAELFEESNRRPVILFKHSVTCPISTNVFEDVSRINGQINLVVVQTARAVSNEIAEKTGIRHESPQAIILRDEKVVYHASHYDITAEDIMRVKS